jgi:hypothetical protein
VVRTLRVEGSMIGYLDAGTGSMIVGAVAAGAAGAGVAVKAGLAKFRRKGRSNPSTASEDADALEAHDEVDGAANDVEVVASTD